MAEQTCTWEGVSGKTYKYWVHSIDTTFKSVSGNYIFARESPEGWYALYIGETGDLSDRLTTSHEKWDCAVHNGMTHIHAPTSSTSQSDRRDEESDLIERWNPVC